MAFIGSKLLGIYVTADSDRQMMIKFYDAISSKVPLFAYRVHDYMTKHWIPKHPKSTSPICAQNREDLSPSKSVQKNSYELLDGWVVNINYNSEGYITCLKRISDALGICLDYKFNGRLDKR